MHKNNKGYTLIEMIIATAIIAVVFSGIAVFVLRVNKLYTNNYIENQIDDTMNEILSIIEPITKNAKSIEEKDNSLTLVSDYVEFSNKVEDVKCKISKNNISLNGEDIKLPVGFNLLIDYNTNNKDIVTYSISINKGNLKKEVSKQVELKNYKENFKKLSADQVEPVKYTASMVNGTSFLNIEIKNYIKNTHPPIVIGCEHRENNKIVYSNYRFTNDEASCKLIGYDPPKLTNSDGNANITVDMDKLKSNYANFGDIIGFYVYNPYNDERIYINYR